MLSLFFHNYNKHYLGEKRPEIPYQWPFTNCSKQCHSILTLPLLVYVTTNVDVNINSAPLSLEMYRKECKVTNLITSSREDLQKGKEILHKEHARSPSQVIE